MSISTIFFDVGCALEDATRASACAMVRATRGTYKGIKKYREAVREKRSAESAAAEATKVAEAAEARLQRLYEEALAYSNKYILLAAEAEERGGFDEEAVRRIVLRTFARDVGKKHPEIGKEIWKLVK